MLEGEYKIIRRAKNGSANDFGLLYDHYIAQIYRFVLLKVSHKQEAEDLSHEIFLSAWKNIERYYDRGLPFSSWLYQIARNKIIDYYRVKKEAVAIDNVSENEFAIKNVLNEDLDHNSAIKKVKSYFQYLSEEQQNVIILRFIEDLSPAEIANAINKSEGAVRIIQHRAIKQLKKVFDQEQNGDLI